MKFIILISLGFVVSGTVAIKSFFDTLKLETSEIEYADTLNCGACVRGGFQYCKFNNVETGER